MRKRVRPDLRIFGSKLGRRFFGMFVACALIPITVLATASYYRVNRQLEDQAFNRLRQSAKSHAMSLYERLLLADRQLQAIQMFLPRPGNSRLPVSSSALFQWDKRVLSGVDFFRDGEAALSWGEGVPAAFRDRLAPMKLPGNSAALTTFSGKGPFPSIAIVRGMEVSGKSRGYLVGTVSPAFMWGLEDGTGLPPAAEFAVWDDQGRSLFSSFGSPLTMDERLKKQNGEMPGGRIGLTIRNEPYYAFGWSAFLKPGFGVPYWTIMIMEPQEYVLQPLTYFRTVFPLIVFMSFVIVLWLSMRAIQRSLVPIESLMRGARRVAERQFTEHVVVASRDEFRDLAVAFNLMTDQLDEQFRTLTARSNVDRAVLSVVDLDEIIVTSLDQLSLLFPCRTVAISLIEAEEPLQGRSFVGGDTARGNPPTTEPFQLKGVERDLFLENRAWLLVDTDEKAPAYLQPLLQPDVRHFVVLPVWLQNRLFALVSLGINKETACDQRDLEQMRGFCDHLAVAFSNSSLISELRDLNLGTLYALARTVDAKSSWTAGHSVRVAQMATEIGVVMGLSRESIDDLQRAGLLHDIGKIGIPLRILDKNGPLTDEEYRVIKGHPSAGARILDPIRAYAGIIPVVEQHHERHDGKGYPHGRSGERIHPSARILALADAYDAMVSDRPYRSGLPHERAMQIVEEEAGRQFDPPVVAAFRQVIGRRKQEPVFPPSTESSTLPNIGSFTVSSPGHMEPMPAGTKEVSP